MAKNFNVVLPLANLILGTLLLRSTLQFKRPGDAGCATAISKARPREEVTRPALHFASMS